MRKAQFLIFIVAASVLFAGPAGAGSIKQVRRNDAKTKEEVSAALAVKRDFIVNERLVFRIAWNGIPVGSVTAESKPGGEYKGYKVYDVRVRTDSNKFLSQIYRVEDLYISFVDVSDMTSRRFEADRKEGNYRKHVIVEYDFSKKEATYSNLRDGSVKTCLIKDRVFDPVSASCYFMTLPLKEGDKVDICVNLNEKNYELYGQVENYGIVKLSGLGEFKAFKIRPYVYLEGQEYRKGTAWMYFSAGEKRYPLYGAVYIPFGKVTAVLDRIEQI